MATKAKEAREARSSRNGGDPTTGPHREAWNALCRAHAAVTGRLQDSLTDAGQPPLSWYGVLDAVATAPEQRIRMGDLAEALVISRGGLTKLVDRLVKAGLLERDYCASDRRVSYAVLSPSGREVYAEMRPVVVAELRGAFTESLSARQAESLRDGLVKISNSACSA